MTGEGYEILVDSETRTWVLAKFLDGNLIGTAEHKPQRGNTERTLVAL